MRELIGKIPVLVTESYDPDVIIMQFSDGSEAMWYHEQDCCETVEIEDVCGHWTDLYGHPLLVAEERVSDEYEPVPEGSLSRDCSDTWTFYTFRSVGGSVDVRWHGSSNGYYSERVSYSYIAWSPA